MIEITTYQAIGLFIAIFSAGATLGYRFSPRVHSSTKTFCNTPTKIGNRNQNIAVTKDIINGKCKDVSCVYMQENKICEYTNHKCKLL